jgi:hypothetical protein
VEGRKDIAQKVKKKKKLTSLKSHDQPAPMKKGCGKGEQLNL